MSEPIPFVPNPSETPVSASVDLNPVQQDADETKKLRAAKEKALLDPHVKELQDKLDSAPDNEAAATSRRYHKALYAKMREIDPSIKDRIDHDEAAFMKLLDKQ